eukprot:262530_1
MYCMQEPLAVIFMVGATIFGALILTNLLIALMTTEYEHVQEAAKGEVIYNKADLAYDLSNRSRLMPPPLNIVVLIISLIIHVFNIFYSLIIHPTTLNIYYYMNHTTLFNLQHYNIFRCQSDQRILRHYKQADEDLTRSDLLWWYFIAWWSNDSYAHSTSINQTYKNWKSLHKGCYGTLLDVHDEFTIMGINMLNYLDRYEKTQKYKVETNDKKLLKALTKDTLFCECCFKPFLQEHYRDELASPFTALLDILSAIMFVVFPISLIPLLILFGVMALVDYAFDSLKISDNDEDDQIYEIADWNNEHIVQEHNTQDMKFNM